MSTIARLEETGFRPSDELAALLEQARGDGAIVSFTGIARPGSGGAQAIYRLVLDDHPALTLHSLEDIAVEAAARFDVSHIRIVHRCGKIAAGDPVVFAGAAALHRQAALEAADYLIDRLETDAVFSKHEVRGAASDWIEPTDAD